MLNSLIRYLEERCGFEPVVRTAVIGVEEMIVMTVHERSQTKSS
jgi:hypothetical protein